MYTQIAANKRKTVLLILFFLVLLSGFGWILSQIQSTPGLFIAVALFALIYAWFSYYNSAKIALFLAGARAIDKKAVPELFRVIENLSITSGLPMPKVYLINDPAPNAFATGRNPQHAAVAVTSGLLELLDKQELEGVIAHELSHVGNYDIRVMGIVLMLVTIIVFVSDFVMRMAFWGGFDDDNNGGNNNAIFLAVGIAAAIIAPILATLVQLAVSREREYLADASGALLTRYPDGLATALTKISTYPKNLKRAGNATAHLYIASPFKGKAGNSWIARLFSTHPPVEERIRRLHDMSDEL